MVSEFELVVDSVADKELRLTVSGSVDMRASQRVNEALIAALRGGPPVLHLDLREAAWPDAARNRVVGAALLLARHLEVRLEVIDGSAPSSVFVGRQSVEGVASYAVRGVPGRQTMLRNPDNRHRVTR